MESSNWFCIISFKVVCAVVQIAGMSRLFILGGLGYPKSSIFFSRKKPCIKVLVNYVNSETKKQLLKLIDSKILSLSMILLDFQAKAGQIVSDGNFIVSCECSFET